MMHIRRTPSGKKNFVIMKSRHVIGEVDFSRGKTCMKKAKEVTTCSTWIFKRNVSSKNSCGCWRLRDWKTRKEKRNGLPGLRAGAVAGAWFHEIRREGAVQGKKNASTTVLMDYEGGGIAAGKDKKGGDVRIVICAGVARFGTGKDRVHAIP